MSEPGDFGMYMRQKSETRAATAEYNRASVALELAHIRERLAEIKSQHEPLAALMNRDLTERDKLYAAAYYVVTGRPMSIEGGWKG